MGRPEKRQSPVYFFHTKSHQKKKKKNSRVRGLQYYRVWEIQILSRSKRFYGDGNRFSGDPSDSKITYGPRSQFSAQSCRISTRDANRWNKRIKMLSNTISDTSAASEGKAYNYCLTGCDIVQSGRSIATFSSLQIEARTE